jgi:galactokinase
MKTASELSRNFLARYGASPSVFRAPGRVNLIGEHTDYNDGFVLPAAINFYAWVGISPRDDQKLMVFSENMQEGAEWDLRSSDPQPRKHWADYVEGVAITLERAGFPMRGANLLIHGEVPLGAGLSSSAALEVAVGCALLDNAHQAIGRKELARLCQRAENDFVGARCGIMDQFVACSGEAGNALLLDCRSLEYRLVRVPHDVLLVICNTMVKHELAGGEYNARRKECEESAQLLAKFYPHVSALRDVSLEELERHRGALSDIAYRRSRHVISENTRVAAAARALELGDLENFGRLMAESHVSLRNDFQVSCQELDLMVELATGLEGVYGSRMTGGGFGGCTISLVRADCVDKFQSAVASGYQRSTGRLPEMYVSRPAAGAGRIME